MTNRKTLIVAAIVLLAWAIPATAGEIHQAITEGNTARVAELLRGDPDLAVAVDENDRFLSLPLHTAANMGNVEIARLLVNAGSEIDCWDSDESTPLQCAAVRRHAEMTEYLIFKGADVNFRDRNGAYALSFAASGGDSTIVHMILEAGADLNYFDPQGITLLHYAVSRNLQELFDRVIDRSDINAALAGNGDMPIHWAATGGHAGMIEALIERSADPNAASTDEVVPLLNCAQRGHTEAGTLLLSHGANVNVANSWGGTPLYTAAMRGHTEFIEMLLDHGADPNLATDRGDTPLMRALEENKPDVLRVLLANGAKTDIADPNYGFTLVHAAAILGNIDCLKSLLDSGASINKKDRMGNTPLKLAAQYGHKDVVDILKTRGGKPENETVNTETVSSMTNLPKGEAMLWSLEHSGWAIKTSNHLIIIDYFEDVDRGKPSDPALRNGYINPAEIAGENVTVFATHVHGDHYDPVIFSWRDQLPNVTYALGCEPADQTGYQYTAPRTKSTINGIKVTTIESNDTGVGYMFEVDGLVIYHAGDHANRHQDWSGPYRTEIDYLVAEGFRPDIAMMPISGCGFGDQVAVKMGVHYAMEKLNPKVFIPMHSGSNTWRYHRFIEECKDQFPKIKMDAPVAKGDRFHYKKGRIS